MKLADINRATDRIVELKPCLWAWAMLLGEARTASNDQQRHRRSDRGRFNSQVDLLGALGELVLLRTAMAGGSNDATVAYMRDHLYREQGGRGVVGPDIRFEDEATGTIQEIDVKTFDCSPNKKWFAINANKHQSLLGQCSAYFCVVTPPFGRCAAISKLVPYVDVDRWPATSLLIGGSASRNCPLGNFLKGYFSTPPNVGELRSSTFQHSEIQAAIEARTVRAALAEMIPSLQYQLDISGS